MAASVWSSPVVLLLFLVCPVLCLSNTLSFTRDEQVNIQQYRPHSRLTVFEYSDVLLDTIVGGAAVLFIRSKTTNVGSEPTALPSILLANLQTLPALSEK